MTAGRIVSLAGYLKAATVMNDSRYNGAKNTLIESLVDKLTNGNQLVSHVSWPLDLQVWNGVDKLKLDGYI